MPDIVSKLLRATIWSCCAVLFESEQTPFPGTGRISFATYWAANFGCYQFRIIPDIISKLLCAAIWSRCAVQFKSEQMPFRRTGHQLRSAALHWILFWTCCSVPMSYFYYNDRKIELGRCFGQQQLLANSIQNFISHEKKKSALSLPNIYKALKPFWLSNWASIARVVARFPEANRLLPSSTAANSETPYVCARPSDSPTLSRSAAPRAWPLILPLNLPLSSGIAFGRNCQMNCRGSNLNWNLNSAAWPTGCKGFICSKVPK